MKIGKLTNVTTAEAGGLIAVLGGKIVLYRDTPLLNVSQIPEILAEVKANKCDTVFFDKGAIFDAPAYDLAVQTIESMRAWKVPNIKIVIYNKP